MTYVLTSQGWDERGSVLPPCVECGYEGIFFLTCQRVLLYVCASCGVTVKRVAREE